MQKNSELPEFSGRPDIIGAGPRKRQDDPRYVETLAKRDRFIRATATATAVAALVAGLVQLAGHNDAALDLTVAVAAVRLFASEPIMSLLSAAYLAAITRHATRKSARTAARVRKASGELNR